LTRAALTAAAVAAAVWIAWGLAVVVPRRAPRPPAPAGELRGAWHVHTTASDGRGSLDEVVRSAREAGLRFVVTTEHNVRAPAAPEWRGGVLVVPGTEISSRLGHVVAVGVPRALTAEERRGDPFAAVEALGGRAVLAHPLHPRRAFAGDWTDPRVAAVEPVSNDSLWGNVVAGRRLGTILAGIAALPWDGAQAVLALYAYPADELKRYDEVVAAAARVPALLCSADAHGWPSYRAAFEAFSMHVPVTPAGDAAADAAAVVAALLDGRAACVFDGVAPGWGARLERRGDALFFRSPGGGTLRAFRDGARAVSFPRPGGPAEVAICPGRCAPGAWRVEATRDGRPWIFTNPVRLE
jgi:hypothetical protein